MSLLLNALKKAEEGELPAAQNTAPAGVPDATRQTAGASSAVDFDAIVEEESSASGDAERGKRVDAARVFGATNTGGETSGGSGFSKFLIVVVCVLGLGGLGYGALEFRWIPGVDKKVVMNWFGATSPVVVQQQVDTGAKLEVADNIVLLPVPAVDVQSEVDFAALRLPENNRSSLGEDEYVKQIAFLTGFDINQEKERKIEEQRALQLQLEVDSDEGEGANSDLLLPEAKETQGATRTFTADASREAKLRLEAKTPSDSELDIKINSAVATAASSSESQSKTAVAQKSAQVEIFVSSEGQERQNMIRQARVRYLQGDYSGADGLYRNVLVSAPSNRDALRGLAQVAIATGRYQSAVAVYLDILGYYPNDPVAIAELSNLRGNDGNFYEIEKALKSALGVSPDADGRLYFSLGNLYAGQRKFNDAQQAYFDAFSRENNNPDYAYNLAVMLDLLNKRNIALRYYQEALRLSKSFPVGFNRQEVESRINDLQ